MLALVLCIIMKIVEMSGAPAVAEAPPRGSKKNNNKNNNSSNNAPLRSKNDNNDKLLFKNMAHDKNNNNNNNNTFEDYRRNNLNKRVNNINNVWRTQHRMMEWHRRRRFKQEEKKRKGLQTCGRTGMTEEIGKGTGVPSSGDFISNNNGETTASYISNTSSQHDADFIQDNSEYQWFVDYGYREGMQHQVSVLSSLSESYARDLLSSGIDSKACGRYDDLARNLDANLAEVDMENFRAEDIHSLLTTLPNFGDLQGRLESNGQCSVSGVSSRLGRFDFDSSLSPHSSSQGEDSAGSIDTMSLCKSELLFSPVKETSVPGIINFSVDSLDSDIMLTCQANKDNYTIAFEGSTTMGSEDSEEYQDQGESEATSTDSHNWSKNSRLINPALAAVLGAEQRSLLNSSLSSTSSGKSVGSECGRPNCKKIQSAHGNMARSDSTFTTWSKLKKPETENPLEQQQLSRHPSGNNNTTQGTEEDAQPNNTSTEEQAAVKSRSLPNLARQNRRRQHHHIRANLTVSSSSSVESSCVKLYDVRCHGSPLSTSGASGASTCSGGRQAGGINLVRLFMKQRSGSDHSSSVSDGWDSDSCVRSATCPVRRDQDWQPTHVISQSCRGRQVFRSCPGAEAQRNDTSVDECQCLPEESMTKAPHCGHPRKNNHGWVRGEENTDCSTCTFEDSLYRLEDGVHRTHEQIAEEEAEHSENVEPASESIPKAANSCEDDSSNYSSHHGRVHGKGLHKTDSDPCHYRPYNVNNNNSLESEDISSEKKRRRSLGNCCCCNCEGKECRKHMQTPLINRSMQTSCILDVLSKATLHEVKPTATIPCKDKESEKEQTPIASDEKATTTEEKKKEEVTKPVYVYYPNYALPDLGFLKEKKPNLDLAKVYLRPQKFSATTVSENVDLLSKIPACLRQPKSVLKPRRPTSVADLDGLRKKGFDHVRDWSSLTFLLPKEYRMMLADVPEVAKQVDEKSLRDSDLQPLFCLSPTPAKSRPCDCTNLSSASSTNTQPSSGYRGSSTLLSDSSSHAPLFVYRYDSVSSEASLLGTDRKKPAPPPPLPKRSGVKKNISNGETSPLTPPPPRPPLPKGILRTGLDVDAGCNSKMRKEAANKRYSMFELGGGAHAQTNSAAALKRCSLQEPYYLPGHEEPCAEDKYHHHQNHLCSHAEFEDVLRLSDYIHMSTAGLSDISFESEWNEDKMAKLRLQVSRFLSSNGSESAESQPPVKSVSFGSKGLSPVSAELKTPPNSPNVSALLGTHRQYKLMQPLSDLPIREEDPGDSSADERHTSPNSRSLQEKSSVESKKALVTAVSDAVEEIIGYFSGASTPGECARLGDSGVTPAVANSIVGMLCPALYAVLSDGLLPSIATAFGDISNSVWQVVEASAQQGHMTRSLNELVLRLNSEDVFSEGLLKFNAFVFGLLNVGSVDAWLGYLRTRESILRKHYGPQALLLLASRGGPAYRGLTDSLLGALRPLGLLPFRLDLLFECRQLHHSLQRLGAASATSPTSLLRLVRSIQNSVGQLAIVEEPSGLHCADNSSADSQYDLPIQSPMLAPVRRASRNRVLRRPRSCVDPSGDSGDSSNNTCKRWSGVQLGSKLSQALDRLMAEDTEEDYSDSLNTTAPQQHHRTLSDQSTSEDVTLISRDSDDLSLSDRSAAAAKARRANALAVGGKFRRLQMKWEKLSGSGTESREQTPDTSPTKALRSRYSQSGSSRTSPAMSPVKSSSRSSLHSPSSNSSSISGVSRIPRPVTSPVRPPTGIPLPRSATSPTQAQPSLRRPSLPPGIQSKRPPAAPTSGRTSRLDQSSPGHTEPRSPATRPSSLPYKPVPQEKISQRRANSASVSRSGQATRKPKTSSRYVRTVKHQLASDSGHLSFGAGERLNLVLEVDEQWLLCCRGDRKGLVRRSAVVAVQDHSSRF